jgi:hypothetical protein
MKKTRSQKSRDTVPLNLSLCGVGGGGGLICPEDLYLHILYVTIDSDTEPNQVPTHPTGTF